MEQARGRRADGRAAGRPAGRRGLADCPRVAGARPHALDVSGPKEACNLALTRADCPPLGRCAASSASCLLSRCSGCLCAVCPAGCLWRT